MREKNNFWTFFLIIGFFLLWLQAVNYFAPPPKPLDKEKAEEAAQIENNQAAQDNKEGRPGQAAGVAPTLAKTFQPWDRTKWVTLGSGDNKSDYHMEVRLDPNGACVRSLVLNKFRKSDINGFLVKDENGAPSTLDLIPLDETTLAGSFLLYHFPGASKDEYPVETLGKTTWSVVPAPTGKPVEEFFREGDNAKGTRVTFRTNLKDIRIEKVFSIYEGEYHIGLEVNVSRESLPGDGKPVAFRYQLTGARGLPIEGAWYTTIFKNSLIGHEDAKGNFDRDYQEGRALSVGLGGYEVEPSNRAIRYAAVAVQYFTSAIALDNRFKQESGIIKRARPTVDVAVFKGHLRRKENGSIQVLSENKNSPQTFLLAPTEAVKAKAAELRPSDPVAFRYIWEPDYDSGSFRYVIVDFLDPVKTQPLFLDDVTMRVSTTPVELKPGDSIKHRFVLYHGPAKPSQIRYAGGAHKVDQKLIDWYSDQLMLSTIVDYPSAVGKWFLGLSWVVIFFTNKLHWVLAAMSTVVPSLGLCIILLTVMVRGLMFPVSRKQALMSIKMQQLAPELKEIQAKHKGDPQALSRAQMALYRKYNINPLGSCWVILLQMPIFMGLYFALQESIIFRLEPFWPTWIHNLTSPDAMFWWGDNIPYISRPMDYGSFLYFGPSFNLLPIFAVAFMALQQKWLMPPPTTEEQEVQQKMTMVMTCVMGLMFYKVAAGMCMYFIASSVWTLAERQLLPKKSTAMNPVPELEPVPAPAKAVVRDEPSRRKNSRMVKEAPPALTGWAKTMDNFKKWFEDLQKRASK